jgi:hypothetical protein
MTRTVRASCLGGLCLLALLAAPAAAQMPDLRTMSGKPLPVADMPAGTVTVRLARKAPVNPVQGAEVTAIVATAGGESRKRTATSGADGRATFEGLAAGSTFQATVTIDGEALETARFPVPASGGIRVMLIAGLGAGEGQGGGEPQAEGGPKRNFSMGAVTGRVAPAADLPKGTLELDLTDADGKPIADTEVRLGEIHLNQAETGRELQLHTAISDGRGRARFQNLNTAQDAGYAAVIDHRGMRLSTEPFRMSPEAGMRGQILALGRSADPSALKIDSRSRMIIELRQDAVTVMQRLVFQNVSREIFDPGEQGLLLPVPANAVGVQEIPGASPLEIGPGGVRLKAVIPPNGAAATATQVQFGYAFMLGDSSSVDLRQTVPAALEELLIIVPAKANLTLEASGLKTLPEETNENGEKLKLYTVGPVGAGGDLVLTVSGAPTRERAGVVLATSLCCLLVLAAVVWGRAPKGEGGGAQGAGRQVLIERREKLFSELVAVERERRQPGAPSNGVLETRRRDLMGRLEALYRELGGEEGARASAPPM